MLRVFVVALLTTVAYAAAAEPQQPLQAPRQSQNIGAAQMQEAVAEALTDEINSNIGLRARVLQLLSEVSDLKKQIEELKKPNDGSK